MNSLRRSINQQGVALVTVLFALAIAIVVIAQVVQRIHTNLITYEAFFNSEQAYQLCLSGEDWARQELWKDHKENSKDIDHVSENWGKDRDAFEIDGGYIEIRISDLQGRFNLNNIVKGNNVDNNWNKAFAKLISDNTEISRSDAKDLVRSYVDWVDENRSGNAEENEYSSLEPAYRPPNKPMGHPSELRFLKDLEKEDYREYRDKVMPHLVLLEPGTKVNINTVTAPTLAAIADISLSQAEGIVAEIEAESEGFDNLQDVVNDLIPSEKRALISPELETTSQYFEVRVRAKYGEQYCHLVSSIKRSQDDGSMQLLSRDRSQRFIFKNSKDYVDTEKKDLEIDI